MTERRTLAEEGTTRAGQGNILITGASGFIGSFLCEEAVRRGWTVYAAVRRTSSRRWLQVEGLRFLELDLTDKSRLMLQLAEAHVRFDVVVHAAGATKCLHRDDFMLHNYHCTVNLVEALRDTIGLPRQFVYLSSLSAIYGSAYGASKLRTEEWIKSALEPSRYVIFRPTGVYGPRERDYFMMAQSIKRHVDFAVGYKPQTLTFVYVADLVGAIFAAIDKSVCGLTINVTDGQTYSSRAFSDLIQAELGTRCVLHITAPLWFLRLISVVSEDVSRLFGKTSTLNRDKYKIMAQRDWTCDTTDMTVALGYQPQWQLPRGVKETIAWYKQEKWI